MPSQSVHVDIPQPLLERIQERARRSSRTVEAEVVDVLSAAIDEADELPADLQADLAALESLDEASLRIRAESRLSPEESNRLESLHLKARSDGLDAAEQQALRELVCDYERAMLVRARSLELLRRRHAAPA